jgi:hypothetical protein
MGAFSTWLYYLFIKIFVYCIIIVQIANKVGCKQKKFLWWPYKLYMNYTVHEWQYTTEVEGFRAVSKWSYFFGGPHVRISCLPQFLQIIPGDLSTLFEAKSLINLRDRVVTAGEWKVQSGTLLQASIRLYGGSRSLYNFTTSLHFSKLFIKCSCNSNKKSRIICRLQVHLAKASSDLFNYAWIQLDFK